MRGQANAIADAAQPQCSAMFCTPKQGRERVVGRDKRERHQPTQFAETCKFRIAYNIIRRAGRCGELVDLVECWPSRELAELSASASPDPCRRVTQKRKIVPG